MKKFLVLLLLGCPMLVAQNTTTAGSLVTSCVKSLKATNAKGKYDKKHPDDIYQAGQCSGFIQGWLEGMDRAFLTDSTGKSVKFVEVSIQWSELPGVWKIAAAVQKDLQSTPLDSGKPADTILRKVLVVNGLIKLTPYELPPTSSTKCLPTSASNVSLELR